MTTLLSQDRTFPPFQPIEPISHPLAARVRVPGSKSLTNRALLIAALADGTTHLTHALFSDDSIYLARALQALGFSLHLNPIQEEMSIVGQGGQIPARQASLFVGNAGTAARFLTAFLALGEGEYVLDGEPRMRERPMADLVQALRGLGVGVEVAAPRDEVRVESFAAGGEAEAHLPLRVRGGGLPGGEVVLRGDVSSQFLSALLMVAPYARSPLTIRLSTPLSSRPYVEMTLAVMRSFGLETARQEVEWFSPALGRYRSPGVYAIESDASAASYFFAAPAVCGGFVEVEGLSRRSLQGDVGFVDVLEQMGCTVEETRHGLRVSGGQPLRGVDVDLRDMPDVAQTLAAIAPFASTPTRIRGIASARHKETDRIHAACTELVRLGVRVEEHADGMTIYPASSLRPALIRTYNDHRMAMAFSLIGLRLEGVVIENPGCVSKTFPAFFEVLDQLRQP